MTTPANEPGKRADPISWPAEWWVDEKFWREVATRTVAGVLALLFLGVPTLIVASATGTVSGTQLWSLLIGVAIMLLLVVIYLIVYSFIRRRKRKRERALESMINLEEELLRQLMAAETMDIDLKRLETYRDRITRLRRRTATLGYRSRILETVTAVLLGVSASIAISLLPDLLT